MSARAAAGEAWQGVTSGAARTGAIAVLITIICASFVGIDAWAQQQLSTSATSYLRAGGATWIVESPGNIDGSACERLHLVAGVESAAFRPTNPITASASPGFPVTTFEMTAGAVGVLGVVGGFRDGILADEELAGSLGLSAGSPLHLKGPAVVTIGGVFPANGRTQFERAAVALVAPSGRFDECLETTWPPNGNAPPEIQTVVAAGTQVGDIHLSQLAQGLAADPNFAEQWSSRPTKWLPFAAPFVSAMVIIFSVRRRRIELATAEMVGMTKESLALQASIEAIIALIIAGVAAVASVAILRHWLTVDVATEAFAAAINVAVQSAAAGVIGAALAAWSISRHRMFRYLKDRAG